MIKIFSLLVVACIIAMVKFTFSTPKVKAERVRVQKRKHPKL
ncbi:hypothetical protein [Mesonia mobilis]|nr:hypothetical protein [Mesonia mobilis]